MRRLLQCVVGLAWLTTACGDDGGAGDAAGDGGLDGTVDAVVETGLADSGVDGGDDAGPDAGPGSFTIEADVSFARLQVGGTGALALTVTRFGGLVSDIVVDVDGLPAGVSAERLVISDTAGSEELRLVSVASAAQAGPIRFTIRAHASVDPAIQSEAEADLYLAGAPGTPDLSFGDNGTVTESVSTDYNSVTTVRLDSANRLLIGGQIQGDTSAGYVLRLMSDGTRDTTFGTDGVLSAFGTPRSAVSAIATDGTLLITAAWVSDGVAPTAFLRRFSDTGEVDSSFGTGGDVVLPFSVRRLRTRSDSYVAGNATEVAVIDSTGTIDESFVPPSPLPASGWRLGVDAAGRILLPGNASTSHYLVARLEQTGALDTSFGTAGLTMFETPGDAGLDYVRAMEMAVTPAGDGVIFGSANLSGYADNVLTLHRFNVDGSPDTGFGAAGTQRILDRGLVADVAIQPDGSIIAVYAEHISWDVLNAKMSRFRPSGVLDDRFGISGTVDLASFPYAVSYDPVLGRIIVATGSGGQFRLWRYWT